MRCTFFVLLILALSAFAQTTDADTSTSSPVDAAALLVPYRTAAVSNWEADIRKFEALDAAEDDPADAVLFVGSSSIRLWDSISEDMAPYRVIQRGFGGSKYSDVAVFAKRILYPHQYRALVVFVGNDVSGQPDDHSPEQVEQLAGYIVNVSQRHQPDAPVLLIEVTPSESRFQVWPQIRQVNARLREIALTTPNTYFIATAEYYLDRNGYPRSELFVADKLHLNRAGYTLWSTLIRRRLDDVLRMHETFYPHRDSASASR